MRMMKIEEWNKKHILEAAFQLGLSSGGSPATYFFDSIYAPIRLPTATGMPAEWTYMPCGFTYSEVAGIYNARFGGNFWPGWYEDEAAMRTAYANRNCKAVERLIYILLENELKYKKLIELQGYTWNPLWNVDGTELHATIEQHADETTSTGTDVTTERSKYPYDSSSAKKYDQEKTTGSATANTRKVEHDQDAHTVSASDNAFGEALSGGDVYHAEKTVRQGNIGVTKSSELIKDARNVLQWNVLEEYFRDINRQLLIGVF